MYLQGNVDLNSDYRHMIECVAWRKKKQKKHIHLLQEHSETLCLVYFQITLLPVVCQEPHCPVMHLDSSQQPVWRWDTRLGKVVPPPRFLLPLYSSRIWITVMPKLVVGVKCLPCAHVGEEVIVYIGLHGNLDEVEDKRWWMTFLKSNPTLAQYASVELCQINAAK